MIHFLSCDWGTTSFRLRLVDGNDQTILAEVFSSQGVAATYREWSAQDLQERLDFYLGFLKMRIHELGKKYNHSLQGMPVLISGMASSSIGMMELDYLSLPFLCNAADLRTKLIEATDSFPYSLIIVSGAKTKNDVMRGEETLLIGCDTNVAEQYFIFPGTHSKHVLVKNGFAMDLKTYMTGEIFELLARHSILSASLPKNIQTDVIRNSLHFDKGVREGINSNLLNAIFKVRTNQLFKKLSPDENYLYLSGLLIGNELSGLKHAAQGPVTLVCGSNLKEYYQAALVSSGFAVNLVDAEEAFVRGQYRIASQILQPSSSLHKP